MTTYKVVVDGSNIATEGRSLPSLNQLDEAVQCFIEEHPGADVLVIVDTSFAHRVDPTESEIFEAAYNAGEIITPPAGTIGRGDSFILKVADKLGATVFSNDSFQEFHGTYDWLFERGRLIGGKPIPGLGWVFTDRTPVRGPKSREAVREAKRSQVRLGSREASRPMPVPTGPPPFLTKKEEAAAKAAEVKQAKADAKAAKAGAKSAAPKAVAAKATTSVAAEPKGDKRRRGRDRERPVKTPGETVAVASESRPPRAGNDGFVNESLPFVSFVSEHLPGTEVDGLVESYASHGFYVSFGDARGYVPLRGAAPEMPRSARDVARKGDTMTFVVRSFDAERRGIELAIPGSPAASWIGENDPSPASTRDERSERSDRGDRAERGNRKGRRRRGGKGRPDAPGASAAQPAVSAQKVASEKPAKATRADKTAQPVKAEKPKKLAAKKVVAESSAPAKKAASKKAAPAKKAAAAKAPTKAAAPAKKAAPVKAPAKKAVAVKKAAPAKKVAAAKAPAKKAAPAKAPAKKAVAAPAKKAPAKKAPATKVAAKKAPTTKVAAKKVAAKKSK